MSSEMIVQTSAPVSYLYDGGMLTPATAAGRGMLAPEGQAHRELIGWEWEVGTGRYRYQLRAPVSSTSADDGGQWYARWDLRGRSHFRPGRDGSGIGWDRSAGPGYVMCLSHWIEWGDVYGDDPDVILWPLARSAADPSEAWRAAEALLAAVLSVAAPDTVAGT
jgi:hypothetical protein